VKFPGSNRPDTLLYVFLSVAIISKVRVVPTYLQIRVLSTGIIALTVFLFVVVHASGSVAQTRTFSGFSWLAWMALLWLVGLQFRAERITEVGVLFANSERAKS
jgi:hypothetical protein